MQCCDRPIAVNNSMCTFQTSAGAQVYEDLGTPTVSGITISYCAIKTRQYLHLLYAVLLKYHTRLIFCIFTEFLLRYGFVGQFQVCRAVVRQLRKHLSLLSTGISSNLYLPLQYLLCSVLLFAYQLGKQQ